MIVDKIQIERSGEDVVVSARLVGGEVQEVGRDRFSELSKSSWSMLERKLPSEMKYMTEPELAEHLNRQLTFIKKCETKDSIGSMLVIFQDDGICQYGATVMREDAPSALRELADRLERNETIKR